MSRFFRYVYELLNSIKLLQHFTCQFWSYPFLSKTRSLPIKIVFAVHIIVWKKLLEILRKFVSNTSLVSIILKKVVIPNIQLPESGFEALLHLVIRKYFHISR